MKPKNLDNPSDSEGQVHTLPVKKKEGKNMEKLQSRKIPETLIQSYDLILLKEEKKPRFTLIKAQNMSQQTPVPEALITLLKNLPLVRGLCIVQFDGEQKSQIDEFLLHGCYLILKGLGDIYIKSISKIKVIAQHGESDNKKRKLKITFIDEEDTKRIIFIHLEDDYEKLYFLMSGIIVRKLLLDDFCITELKKGEIQSIKDRGNSIEGDILKLSGLLAMKKWEKRHIEVNGGIHTYGKEDNKISSTIKAAKELWTRFNMHQGYFVIKLHHGIEKVQMGIPLMDFSNVSSPKNWLLPLYKVLQAE